jgi:hypothetical protein
MAVNTVNARIARREGAERQDRRVAFPTFRSLRHGVPAATYDERARGSAALSRDVSDRILAEDWGWV